MDQVLVADARYIIRRASHYRWMRVIGMPLAPRGPGRAVEAVMP